VQTGRRLQNQHQTIPVDPAQVNPEVEVLPVTRMRAFRRQPGEQVIDLSAFISERERREVWLIDDKILPDWVELRCLLKYLKITDKTLSKYREIAYRHVPDYKESCTRRYPNFERDLAEQMARQLAGKGAGRAFCPDKPPFTALEAYILIAIAHVNKVFLKKNVRDRGDAVIEFIQEKNKGKFFHWYTALGLPVELPKRD
jgi:hypothetical protein